MKPLRSFGGDIVRGDTDDGDIEFVFCAITVLGSKLFDVNFGECISLDRSVFEPGDICFFKYECVYLNSKKKSTSE